MDTISVSIPALCEACGFKRTTAYALIASGELEAVKVGRRTLVTKRSIEALIERGAVEAKRCLSR
jgi:excisionase family DNA binding protein